MEWLMGGGLIYFQGGWGTDAYHRHDVSGKDIIQGEHSMCYDRIYA